MTEPNEKQQTLIDAIDGIHCVDAGAGTGKTFTITRRYANILDERPVDPDDLLLITFTNNAATEMRDRIVDHCDYDRAALRDAPINTFHGRCQELLQTYGLDAPQHLGIDDRITGDMAIVEDGVIEADYFREFLTQFQDRHPEYDQFVQILNDPSSLLDLIRALLAKGVFPTQDGWYRDSDAYLDGDHEAFQTLFDAMNEPRNEGSKQSKLRSNLGGWDNDHCFRADAPSETELRGHRGTKQIPGEFADRAFEEDRTALKSFVHDIYIEYIEFALNRNYLTFGFLLMFTFAMLCEDARLRAELAHEYVMIDEFQDTNEIQFKLALLFAETNNLCVVGDWKQSIYGFQYAAVENITAFEQRLQTYKAELNGDQTRIDYPVTDVNAIELERNYRSTQAILDFSEQTLSLPATKSDDFEPRTPDPLEATVDAAVDTRIEALTSTDEQAALLTKIQTIVGNEDYQIRNEDGDLVTPDYGDIAVLTRTRDFGREFQTTAAEYNIPVAYEGGIELFDTPQAKLLLAWLRICENPTSDRGWAVVLEQAGHTLAEVEASLDQESYPDAMLAFRERLQATGSLASVARRVFDRYGYTDGYADRLVELVETFTAGTTRTRGELIRFIEGSLDAESTVEVADTTDANSITVQTIHAAKGLEHPIVVLANINESRFPSTGGGADAIRYQEPIGLRQAKTVADDHGQSHVYDNWQYRVLSGALPTAYDEERRLMYVAVTRARDHLLFAAGEDPSQFFTNLDLDPQQIEPDIEARDPETRESSRLDVDIPELQGRLSRSPHDLMDESVYEDVTDGRGKAFGTAVHDFAEDYVNGLDVSPSNDDERHIKGFIDSLEGQLRAEERAILPLTVGEQEVTVSGIIDLLGITDDTVTIIDYKTDLSRQAQAQYRTQLSVYYHVVTECFPDRTVQVTLFYSATAAQIQLTPCSLDELKSIIEQDL